MKATENIQGVSHKICVSIIEHAQLVKILHKLTISQGRSNKWEQIQQTADKKNSGASIIKVGRGTSQNIKIHIKGAWNGTIRDMAE